MRAIDRFLFGTLLVTSLLFLGVGSLLTSYAERNERQRLQEKIATLSRLVVAENLDPLWNADQAAVMAHCKAIFDDPEVTRITVLDPTSAVTVNLRDSEAAADPSRLQEHSLEIRKDGRLLANVDLTFTSVPLEARLSRLRRALWALAGAMVAMILLAYINLRGALVGPLKTLADSIRESRSGALSPVDLPATPELRDLVTTYNDVAVRLGQARDVEVKRVGTIEARNADLEKRLREKEESEGTIRQAQKMEAVARVSGGVGAEFNNLLTSILGFSAMARDQLKPNQQAYADIEEVLHAGERARNLTQQLLSLGRRRQLELRVVEIRALMEAMTAEVKEAAGPQVVVEAKFENPAGSMLVDDGALKQVFRSLAENAREAMPQGGKLLLQAKEVFLEQQNVRHLPDLDPGAYLMVTVADNGVGMTDEVKDRAFEPFYTTRGPDRAGLGLATVHGIVRQFKGDVELLSERGRGTQVILYLPLRAVETEAAAAKAPSTEMPGGSETVLVVEDEETVRRMTRRLLEDKGYRVIEAADGAAGVQAATVCKDRLDLVLSDVVMPNLNGPDMVREIFAARQDFKVLYMSGFTEAKFPDVDATGRHVHLMLKPFTREILYRRVREVLDEPDVVPAKPGGTA